MRTANDFIRETLKEPELVCEVCSFERDAHIPEDKIVTFRIGKCDLCNEERMVAPIGEWGHDRVKLSYFYTNHLNQ